MRMFRLVPHHGGRYKNDLSCAWASEVSRKIQKTSDAMGYYNQDIESDGGEARAAIPAFPTELETTESTIFEGSAAAAASHVGHLAKMMLNPSKRIVEIAHKSLYIPIWGIGRSYFSQCNVFAEFI